MSPKSQISAEVNLSQFMIPIGALKLFISAIKQVCGICRFMVRDTLAIKTHIFCSLQAFVRWEFMRSEKIISNWYEVQRNMFTLVVREHIFANLSSDIII